MAGLIRWICGFAFIVLFAGFAAMNRQSVDFYFTPLHDPLQWPLYLLVLGFTALGFMLGAITVWLSDFRLRRDKRLQKKQIKTLERELSKAKAAPEDIRKPDDTLFPALTKY